jgi:murein tripeptide amidase MpaA
MITFGKFLIIAAAVVSASAERRSYDGYSVLRAKVDTIKQFKILATLRDEGNFDFWSGPIYGRSADILASPEEYPKLTSLLNSHGIPYSYMIDNLQMVISEADIQENPQASMNWNEYFSTEAIYAWLEELGRNNSNVQVLNIGNSTENRLIKLVKISSGGNATKPALWIDGTIHAREWIATTTATYAINQLVNNASAHREILENLDIYILPLVNPDGYEYSRNTDRLWRKTRSILPNTTCIGVDANRNFGYKWSDAGNTNNQCSLTHQGAEPFTEPEARAVRDYISGNNINWQGFITLHSYSQLWMTPWGYTRDLPENYAEMMRVANKSVSALTAVHGTSYEAGSAANILYESEGTSRDWAKGVPNITYVYTIELRDTGRYGFVLPADQILPTGQETWAGIRVLAEEIARAGRA